MNKKILIAVLLAVAVLVAFLVIRGNNEPPQEKILTHTTITRPEINLEFTYKIGEGGYSLSEAPRGATSTDPLLNGFVLRPVSLEEMPVAGEPEPVISIFVIEEVEEIESTDTTTEVAKIDELKDLALKYKSITGYEMIVGETEMVDVDGVDMLHYTSDGLYLHDTYFTSVFGNIYLITGQYIEKDEKIHQDFKELISTLSFL